MPEVFSTDPADLFCQLYDQLPERLFAEDEEAEGWLDDPAVAEIASQVEHDVVSNGRVEKALVERFLEVDESDRNRFAILLGLDLAFTQADLVSATCDTAGLTELTLRYLETGRLSTEAVGGALLPKIAVPAQEHLLPESLRQAFSAVVRVPESTPIQVRPVVLDSWPSRNTRESGVVVAALAAFDRKTELELERIEDRVPCYRVRLGDVDDVEDWVATRLEALDESGAHMAILPELALTPVVLAAWQQICHRRSPPLGSRLRWIVLGSGPETDDRSSRPHNRAVILDRTTGEVLWEQDKQYRFQMEDDLVKRWGMSEIGPGPLEEWIVAGGSIAVAEAPGIRAAVLICEDLTELDTVGATVNAWGVSHAFCPIFSQAIRRYHWENQHGAWLLGHAGTQVIVCNSKWVGDVEPSLAEPSGDVLAISNTVELSSASTPLEPIIVRFTEHGVFAQ